jgi:hypothetical protein
MAELGDEQPRSLANAFMKPVQAKPNADLLASTYASLKNHIEGLDQMYGVTTARRFAGIDSDSMIPTAGDRLSVADLAKWAAGG